MSSDQPSKEAMDAAEAVSNYEEKHFGPISPGYPGPAKHTEVNDIARIIDKRVKRKAEIEAAYREGYKDGISATNEDAVCVNADWETSDAKRALEDTND
jgi:hypothetical protein